MALRPDAIPQPVPPFNTALLPPNLPLSVLGKGIFFAILAFEKSLGAKVPEISRDTDITGAQAQEIIRNMSLEIFPGLRYGA